MRWSCRVMLLFLFAGMMALSAQALDFNGYMRAGVGQNVDGGAATSYGNGGSGHTVGRLGDEVDTYVELALGETLYDEDDKSFSIHTMLVYSTPEGDKDLQGNSWQGTGGEGPWGGQRASLREAYAKGSLGGYSLWAGKRYHQRKDVHVIDFYYINNSGYGAGIEDIDPGIGTLAIAWIQNGEDWQDDYSGGPQGDDWRRINKLDIRWNDIGANTDGTIDVAVILGTASLSDSQKTMISPDGEADNSGAFVTLEHTQGNIMNGFNKAVLQYGSGGYATIGAFENHAGEIVDAVDGDGWRIINWGVLEPAKWNLGYSVMYASRDVTDVAANNRNLLGENEFYNAVLRPGYKWSEVTQTVLELGYANNKAEGGDWEDLSKVTLAQQWNAGSSFWARPSIRAYVAHFWGDQVDAREAATGDKQETMIGVQAEAWW